MTSALTLHATRQDMTAEPQPSKFAIVPAWVRRIGTPVFAGLAVCAVSAMLVVTIYFTLLDIEWLTFLLGVLFAAIVSMVSMTVKAQYRLVRRTAQLLRQKELLAEEMTRGERQTQALKAADARFRTVLDGMPTITFFIDREERLRFHNAAFEAWRGRSALELAGLALKDVVDSGIYQDLKKHGTEALLGRETQFEALWGGANPVSVKLMPYPPEAQAPSGYYAFVASAAGQAVAQELEAPPAPVSPDAASEAAYRNVMEQQLSADGAAREHLLRAIEEDHFLLLEQRIEPLTPEAQPNLREILLRLQENRERALPPAEFFETAERYELMPAIDRWVIRRLLKSCAAMKEADRAWRMPLYCLNLSSATLRDRGFANHVRAQLQHWDIPGARLCFEINHRTLAEQESDIATLMEQLKPLGCRFTVDNFGSYKVSFAPFRELRFDHLKIDGSIVSEVLRSAADLTKVKAIVLACDKIGVQTIAQFVENDAIRTALKDVGVDYVQGFGIGKPGPLAVVAPAGAHA